MVQYWICVTTPINLEIVLKNEVWGIEDDGRIMGIKEKGPGREIFGKHVKIGDRLFFYSKGNYMIQGVYEVASNPYRDHTRKWPDKTYPNRVEIHDINLGKPTRPTLFNSPSLLKGLSFVKNLSQWGTYLQCSMRLITKEDYELILLLITHGSS